MYLARSVGGQTPLGFPSFIMQFPNIDLSRVGCIYTIVISLELHKAPTVTMYSVLANNTGYNQLYYSASVTVLMSTTSFVTSATHIFVNS